MKILKRILIALAGLFVVIQVFRPARNDSSSNTTADLDTSLKMPQDVQQILQTSCYDCHSSTTRYPWYAEIQPVGWWLNNHIQGAKRQLNFSTFAYYRIGRQYHKLEDIIEQVDKDEMPLPSYLLLHADARLSQEQKEKLISWATSMRDSMKAIYPADSLERRKRAP
jgi:hypothetical protein